MAGKASGVPSCPAHRTALSLYYTQNTAECPENLNPLPNSLYFFGLPGRCAAQSAAASSPRPSGHAASRNTPVVAQPPTPNAASCKGSRAANPSASSFRSAMPAAAASTAASAGAPSQRRNACCVPLENSRCPVLAAQVYRLESRDHCQKALHAKARQQRHHPANAQDGIPHAVAEGRLLLPYPFMAPSTMLSRYISGMAGASVSR